MNRELANGIIVGLVIGMFASILFAPEDWMSVKRRFIDRFVHPLSVRHGVVSYSITDEDVH
jgi:hypothetical protein